MYTVLYIIIIFYLSSYMFIYAYVWGIMQPVTPSRVILSKHIRHYNTVNTIYIIQWRGRTYNAMLFNMFYRL
jgi:hypothetical protein